MIKTLEKSARTEELAIAEALKELGMDRDDVSVEILERAKSGFLGIGASPAVIRVSYECPDEEPVAVEEPVVEAEYFGETVAVIEEPQLAEAERIEVIPTLVLYKEGFELGSTVAPESKARIDEFLREALQ